MNIRSFIPKEEVLTLDIIRFQGEIEVIDDSEELKELLRELSLEEYLGFDTETKPSFRKGEYHEPAIVQISTLEKAYLIRIQKTGFTNSLKTFLENKAVKKIGISIRDDLKDMRKVREFEPGGFIDLNNVAERLGIRQIGVKSLTGIFLNKRVSKGQQTSNWENENLTINQQNYAATDAWVCLEMYHSLLRRGYV
ncbi:MAG: 3'-5' exonuclease domain-containing protein 2 [Cyclobacteriaceae bacterium]